MFKKFFILFFLYNSLVIGQNIFRKFHIMTSQSNILTITLTGLQKPNNSKFKYLLNYYKNYDWQNIIKNDNSDSLSLQNDSLLNQFKQHIHKYPNLLKSFSKGFTKDKKQIKEFIANDIEKKFNNHSKSNFNDNENHKKQVIEELFSFLNITTFYNYKSMADVDLKQDPLSSNNVISDNELLWKDLIIELQKQLEIGIAFGKELTIMMSKSNNIIVQTQIKFSYNFIKEEYNNNWMFTIPNNIIIQFPIYGIKFLLGFSLDFLLLSGRFSKNHNITAGNNYNIKNNPAAFHCAYGLILAIEIKNKIINKIISQNKKFRLMIAWKSLSSIYTFLFFLGKIFGKHWGIGMPSGYSFKMKGYELSTQLSF